MELEVSPESVYIPSEDIVAREIEGELLIIPLVSGIGDMEDEIYDLNETGKIIWNRLDSKEPLREIARELSKEYNVDLNEMMEDVIGFMQELFKRGIVVELSKA